jgi:hypothetical protein
MFGSGLRFDDVVVVQGLVIALNTQASETRSEKDGGQYL